MTIGTEQNVSSKAATSYTRSVQHTETIGADRDSFVATSWPNSNFGSLANVTVGTATDNTRHGYLHFTRPAGTVVSAQLVLSRDGAWTPSTLVAGATTAAWSETGIVAGNAPPAQRTVGTGSVASTSSTVTLDVTTEFRIYTASTIVIGENQPVLVQFASRQATSGRPMLRLVYSQQVVVNVPQTSQTGPTSPSTSPTSPSTSPTSPSTSPTSPSTSPTSPSTSPTSPSCTVSAILVPSCGHYWGAGTAFSTLPLATKVAQDEQLAGRQDDIVHVYHVNDQLFPTPQEKAVALQPGHNRLLLVNWKPATDMSWAAVAAGGADTRIDKEAAYIRTTFPYKFFLTIYHEPEDNVNPTAGSGMTALDYAAMYRHTVLRLRADGVTNAVTVINFMGFDPWAQQSWFNQLWPGDDVVDWIGLDPYGTGATSGYSARDLATLVNRPATGFPGYYSWATQTHPGKPIMLCEWGVRYDASAPAGQATFFASVRAQLASYPQIKGMLYFDVPSPAPAGEPLTDPTLNADALAGYRALASSDLFSAPSWSY